MLFRDNVFQLKVILDIPQNRHITIGSLEDYFVVFSLTAKGLINRRNILPFHLEHCSRLSKASRIARDSPLIHIIKVTGFQFLIIPIYTGGENL